MKAPCNVLIREGKGPFKKLMDFLKTFEKDVIYIVVDPALRFREMGL